MRRPTHLARAAVTLAALLLAACATQRPEPSRPVPRPAQPVVPARVPSTAAYLATAASIDLYVVRACDLALERSSSPRILALARDLGAGHRGLAGQLSLAGRRLNALPAARLLPREADRLAWLATRQPFDTTFFRQMMLTHEQGLALHTQFAARGTSPTLRAVAVHAAEVEQAHLVRLRAR